MSNNLSTDNSTVTIAKFNIPFPGGKNNLANAVIALGISINRTNFHDGEHLAAIIDAINTYRCKHLYIVIGDGNLLSTNLAINLELNPDNPDITKFEEIYDTAQTYGKKWLQHNQYILNGLKVPHTILHWNEIIGRPSYWTTRSKVDNLYISEPHIREGIEESIKQFVKRYKRQFLTGTEATSIKSVPTDEIINRWSREYLLQEGVGLTRVLASMGVNFIFYPAPQLKAVEVIRNFLLSEQERASLAIWINYSFHNVKIKPSTQHDLEQSLVYKFFIHPKTAFSQKCASQKSLGDTKLSVFSSQFSLLIEELQKKHIEFIGYCKNKIKDN